MKCLNAGITDADIFLYKNVPIIQMALGIWAALVYAKPFGAAYWLHSFKDFGSIFPGAQRLELFRAPSSKNNGFSSQFSHRLFNPAF